MKEIISKLQSLFHSRRYCFGTERELQDQIEVILKEDGLVFSREHRLSAEDRPDFFLPDYGLALEVKISGSMISHLRQIKRYAAHDGVKAVLLVSPRPYFLPITVGGKPCFEINLWRQMI